MAKDEADGARDEEQQAAGEGKAAGGSGKMKAVIAGAMVLLVVPLVSYVIFAVLVAPMWEKAGAEEKPPPVKFGPMYEMPTVIVNLAETRGTRYLKVTAGFEMSRPTLQEELDERKPQISDLMIDVLSSKTISEISDHEGKVKLKRELLEKINEVLIGGKLVNVYFMEFVVQ